MPDSINFLGPVRQKQVPWKVIMLDACSTILPPLRKRLLSCTGLCLLYLGSPGPAARLLAPLFSVAPRYLEYVGPFQWYETNETESSASGSPLKGQHIRCMLQHFSSSGRNWELGIFSHLSSAELGRGTMVNECSKSLPLFSVAPNLVPFPFRA